MIALPREFIQNIVRAALAEDIGAGDITTDTAIPTDQSAEASIVAKEPCVVAGLPLVAEVFAQVDRAVIVKLLVGEGDFVEQGTRACVLNGPARGILTGERAALNFLQRLSGIATLTRQFVEQGRRHEGQNSGHTQDHAHVARVGEIRGSGRRRHQSSPGSLRRRHDQGQPPRRSRPARPKGPW